MKKIGIRDVAKEAGVSITTVSRALNGYSDVSKETKEKIFEVVERLNYAPDTSARSLGGKSETNIALLTSELREKDENGFVYGLINGLFEQCNEQGCEFMLLATNKARQEKLSFLQLCKRKNLSGVVVTGLLPEDPYYEEILNSNLPCAIVDMNVYGRNKCRLTIDNIKAAREAVEYLIDFGHQHIGMINGTSSSLVSKERYQGYQEAMKHHQLEIEEDYILDCAFRDDISYQKVKKLIKDHSEITALFCASDMMAIGAIRAIEDLGFSVPEDISVIGFDDIPIAEYIYKGLTTIRQNPILIGKKGGEAVWKMIQKEEVAKEYILSHELVIRKTVNQVKIK